MSYLRHPSRQVLRTVSTALDEALAALGWYGPTTTPAGAPVLRLSTAATLPHQRASTFSPGMVIISLGDTPADDLQELGGPLTLVEYPIFVDIVMATDVHALLVADDVRDIFRGLAAGTSRFMPVTNYGENPPVATDWMIELDDVIRVRPDHDLQVHWQVVKATASTYYNETVAS